MGKSALRFLAVTGILTAVALASGCAARGITLDRIAADRSIITGSAESAAPIDPAATSDETTIRNAVSSADLEGLERNPLGWTNTLTGSRGRVVDISEHREAGRPCRRFRTTRESFDGIGVYRGEVCLLSDDEWTMLSFQRL
jgi:hypothetical protein